MPGDDRPLAEVRVVDIDVPLGQLVILAIKVAVASLPALFFLAIVFGLARACFGGR